MNTYGNHAHGSDSHNPHPAKPASWKRVHHDWHFWVGSVLALLCMIYYVMTMDLAWRPRVQPPQSNTVGK